MPTSAKPRWTVVTTLVSSMSDEEWHGESWEFFDDELNAQLCFAKHRASGNVPTMRPFYTQTDWPHLNVVQRGKGMPND
jgi:hypothetical protein